jgi:tetratricopeptide (TPR) repeat protein
MADKFIIIIVIFTAAYITFPALAEEPPIDMSRMEEFLSGRADHKDAHDVISKIQEDIGRNPENHANYAALAFVYDYTNLPAKALEAIKAEIKYSPEKSGWDMIYGNLAREYFSLDRIDEVKKPALKSVRYNPKNISSHMNLLKYYILKGRYKEAAAELKTISSLDKEMDFYYEIYKCCFDKIKDKNKIIELFREAVKANPDNYMSHRALGTAMRDLFNDDMEKNLPVIMKSFNKAVELNPKYIPTYISIANTYMYLGLKTNKNSYYNDALKCIDRAYKLEPENLKVAYCMGNIFLAMGQYDKGLERLEYAISRGGNDKDTIELLAAGYNNKAYTYYETGKNLEEGLKIINKAIMLSPKDSFILSTKAELLYKMQKFDEAYKYIQKAVKFAPDEPGIKMDLANLEKTMKKKSK